MHRVPAQKNVALFPSLMKGALLLSKCQFRAGPLAGRNTNSTQLLRQRLSAALFLPVVSPAALCRSLWPRFIWAASPPLLPLPPPRPAAVETHLPATTVSVPARASTTAKSTIARVPTAINRGLSAEQAPPAAAAVSNITGEVTCFAGVGLPRVVDDPNRPTLPPPPAVARLCQTLGLVESCSHRLE